ncbi:MAG: hypothetical protein ABIJ21_09155 [Nanoarchaeota archaeon]
MRSNYGRQRGHVGLTLGFLGLLLAVAFFLADHGFFGEINIPYPASTFVFVGLTGVLSLLLISNGLKRN